MSVTKARALRDKLSSVLDDVDGLVTSSALVNSRLNGVKQMTENAIRNLDEFIGALEAKPVAPAPAGPGGK